MWYLEFFQIILVIVAWGRLVFQPETKGKSRKLDVSELKKNFKLQKIIKINLYDLLMMLSFVIPINKPPTFEASLKKSMGIASAQIWNIADFDG